MVGSYSGSALLLRQTPGRLVGRNRDEAPRRGVLDRSSCPHLLERQALEPILEVATQDHGAPPARVPPRWFAAGSHINRLTPALRL
jgi:hypothetical protein